MNMYEFQFSFPMSKRQRQKAAEKKAYNVKQQPNALAPSLVLERLAKHLMGDLKCVLGGDIKWKVVFLLLSCYKAPLKFLVVPARTCKKTKLRCLRAPCSRHEACIRLQGNQIVWKVCTNLNWNRFLTTAVGIENEFFKRKLKFKDKNFRHFFDARSWRP